MPSVIVSRETRPDSNAKRRTPHRSMAGRHERRSQRSLCHSEPGTFRDATIIMHVWILRALCLCCDNRRLPCVRWSRFPARRSRKQCLGTAPSASDESPAQQTNVVRELRKRLRVPKIGRLASFCTCISAASAMSLSPRRVWRADSIFAPATGSGRSLRKNELLSSA